MKLSIGRIIPCAMILVQLCLSAGCAFSPFAPSDPAPLTFYRGLNMFGPFQNAISSQPWLFPTDAELSYYAARGLTVLRVPLLWENLQPTLYGSLDPTYLAAMDTFVSDCAATW